MHTRTMKRDPIILVPASITAMIGLLNVKVFTELPLSSCACSLPLLCYFGCSPSAFLLWLLSLCIVALVSLLRELLLGISPYAIAFTIRLASLR